MSFAVLLPWLLLAAAVAAAAVLFARARSLAGELTAGEAETQRVTNELQASREQLDKAIAKQQRSSEELAHSRRKLEKARKRAARAGDDARPATASHSLTVETALEAARQERDAAHAKATALAEELAKARAAIDAAARERPQLDAAAIEELQQRSATIGAEQEQLRGERKQLRTELAAAHANEKRLRDKLDTQQQLYVAIRGELEAKKDRLRTQNEEVERLRALRVAVQDDESRGSGIESQET